MARSNRRRTIEFTSAAATYGRMRDARIVESSFDADGLASWAIAETIYGFDVNGGKPTPGLLYPSRLIRTNGFVNGRRVYGIDECCLIQDDGPPVPHPCWPDSPEGVLPSWIWGTVTFPSEGFPAPGFSYSPNPGNIKLWSTTDSDAEVGLTTSGYAGKLSVTYTWPPGYTMLGMPLSSEPGGSITFEVQVFLLCTETPGEFTVGSVGTILCNPATDDCGLPTDTVGTYSIGDGERTPAWSFAGTAVLTYSF